MNWKASCRSSPPPAIGAGEARLGSRLSALLRVSLPPLVIDRDRKTGAQRALLAKSERGQLVYAGPAFIALRAEARQEFESKLVKLKQDRPIFSWLRNRDARWVKPVITLKVSISLLAAACCGMQRCVD